MWSLNVNSLTCPNVGANRCLLKLSILREDSNHDTFGHDYMTASGVARASTHKRGKCKGPRGAIQWRRTRVQASKKGSACILLAAGGAHANCYVTDSFDIKSCINKVNFVLF